MWLEIHAPLPYIENLIYVRLNTDILRIHICWAPLPLSMHHSDVLLAVLCAMFHNDSQTINHVMERRSFERFLLNSESCQILWLCIFYRPQYLANRVDEHEVHQLRYLWAAANRPRDRASLYLMSKLSEFMWSQHILQIHNHVDGVPNNALFVCLFKLNWVQEATLYCKM